MIDYPEDVNPNHWEDLETYVSAKPYKSPEYNAWTTIKKEVASLRAKLKIAVKTIEQLRPYGHYLPTGIEGQRQFICDDALSAIRSEAKGEK